MSFRKRGALIALLVVISVVQTYAQDTEPPVLVDAFALDSQTLDIAFDEPIDSASAFNLDNFHVFVILHDQFESEVVLDTTDLLEDGGFVELTTVQPLSLFDREFALVTNNIADKFRNVSGYDTLLFEGTSAYGYTNLTDPDNYVLKLHVQRPDATPAWTYVLPVHNDGPDGEDYQDGVSTDDIDFVITCDLDGDIRIEGLPSTPGVNMSEDGVYDISKWDDWQFEPYGWEFNVFDHPDSMERTVTLYFLEEGTGLVGRIADSNGDPISFWGYSADDIIQIRRGDVSVWTHPPSYTDTSANMYYNPLTGDYRAWGRLGGGGTYDIDAFLPGTEAVQTSVSVAPGTVETLDITLVAPVKPDYFVEIAMDEQDPIPTPGAMDEITLSWHKVLHDSVNSYVVGLWNESDILKTPNPDSLWTRIAPGILHVAVPATDSSITIGNLLGPQIEVLSPVNANTMSASGIDESQKVYWGVYASTWGPDSLTAIALEDHFSGYPEGGLQLLIEQTDDVSEIASLPRNFAIQSVYPNPFNPTTTVQIALPEAAPLTVEVFNVLGRRVATLVDRKMQDAGIARFVLDGSALSSGLYFVRATAPGGLAAVRKVVLMR